MNACRRLVRSLSHAAFAPLPLASHRIAGRRPADAPVLFLHGLFGSRNNWKSIARQVTAVSGRTTFCLDLRNHGDSPHSDPDSGVTIAMAVDLKEFVRKEELHSCILVGHSLGGRVALQFASLYPDSPEKVIAVDVSPLSLPSSMHTMSSYIDAMANVVEKVSATDGLAIARTTADLLLTPVIQEKLVRDFLMMNLVRDGDGKLKWKFNLHALRALVAQGRIREVQFDPNKPCDCTTVFIYGQKSDFVCEGDLPAILKLFPNSTFHCIADAGHYLHVEKQPEFLSVLCSNL